MSLNKDISNLSYTNKDFNSIYTELLEYAKKMSYRWDPSASDESDPGVVLLKLAAIIGDKNNYNIDKNVLELMPSSVTQIGCARQLFEQCGYIMRYYRAASGEVNITLNGHPEEPNEEFADKVYVYTVPRFTMFSDIDNETIFTSTEETVLEYQTNGPQKSSSVAIPVIEGTATQYRIHNDALITINNLDSHNRIYFTESDIAENGIFITNVDSSKENFSNYDDWKKVDTLETQPKNSKCYKFSVSLDGSLCYIQFPEDVEFLFGEGINITYIRTKGIDGNIVAKAVRQFYVDTSFKKQTIDGQDNGYVNVSAGEDETAVITLINNLPITNGKNPETIEEAYRSYRRVKTTFDTLVSVKDYTDYMITSESASNGYVCDRTNDIQHAYKIQETLSSGTIITTAIETKETNIYDKNDPTKFITVDEPSMKAFDLCVYALQYVPTIADELTYKESFQLTDGSKYRDNLNNMSINSIQHDFVEFDTNKILMVKNKYPILCTIIPRYVLSGTEMFQIRSNIELALYKAINSKQISFGEGIDYTLLESTILNADDRIKHIEGLTTPKYTTWVCFAQKNSDNDSVVYKEMRIDNDSFSGGYIEASVDKNDFDNNKSTLYRYDVITNSIIPADEYDTKYTYYTFDKDLHDLWLSFRSEIFAKNVLAGITPLYEPASNFDFGVTQKTVKEYTDIEYISTETEIALIKENDTTWVTDTLKENETILLSAPNFIQENSFSTYVKMIYSFNTPDGYLDSSSKHVFENGEFIIFFWKAADSDSDYTYLKYDSTSDSKAPAMSPSFAMPCTQPRTNIVTSAAVSYFSKFKAGKGRTSSALKVAPLGNITETEFVKSLNSSDNYQVLTGSQSVITLKENKIQINNETNGSTNIYWILNATVESNGTPKYRLFDKNDTKYTLNSGEYLLYTNSSKTTLYLLGEGTVIERSGNWEELVWEVPVLTYSDVITEGIDVLDTYWFTIKLSSSNKLIATEMQQQLIGPGNKLKITKIDNTQGDIDKLNSDPTDLVGYSISYIDTEDDQVNITDVEGDGHGWTASTILNVNMSSTEPQRIYSNQTIRLHKTTSHEGFEIIAGDDPLYIIPSQKFNLVGGKFIDLSPLYAKTFDFATYTIAENTSNDVTYSEDKLGVTMMLSGGTKNGDTYTWQVTIKDFELLAGSYLFSITSDNKLLGLSASTNTASITFESLLSATEVNNIYKLVSSKDAKPELIISVVSSDEQVRLNINPLIRYSNENLQEISMATEVDKSGTTFESMLLAKLDELDINNKFNYIDFSRNSIKNPLESETFLKTEHVYNPYMICQWVVKDSVEEDIVINSGIR